MHIKTHYTPTTTHPTTNKHKVCLYKWWPNGTRCRDGVKALWCHSHLVWLVFEASIPTCTCFPSENFLWLVSVVFSFLYCHLGMVREKKGGRGRHMVNFFVHIKLRIIINSNASKWNCKFIHHTSLWGFRAYKSPTLTSCGLLFGSAHSIES